MMKLMIVFEDQWVLLSEGWFLMLFDAFLHLMIDRKSGKFLFLFFDLVVKALI